VSKWSRNSLLPIEKGRFTFVNTTDYLGLFTLTDIFHHVKIGDRRKDISDGETRKT